MTPHRSAPDNSSEEDEDSRPNARMRLYLMRHGIAIDRSDPDCPAEAERFLTAKGVQRTRGCARGLRALRVKPTTLLTSPYVRAVQTGEIVCEVMGIDPKRLHTTDALKPEAKPGRLVEELNEIATGDVICFGHAPQLDDFIAHATRATSVYTELKKAGVACLDVEGFSPMHATLYWLLTSKVLRRLEN